MNTKQPMLSIYCLLKNGKEDELMFDIDLSHDPLLNKPYTESWIIHLIEKKYKIIDDIEQIHISQYNNIYELPEWYVNLQ
jgi:hypothetical protein